MSKRLPIISNLIKICIICEGDEEVEYLSKLIELEVWNNTIDIYLVNAHGNGNIAARYQDAFQNGNYDMVFAFVDTDRAPHDQYKDIKRKINNIYGLKTAADLVVIFGNPCTLQIIILHFSLVKLQSHLKGKNKDIIEKYTGIDAYNAKKEKRKMLFSLINTDNYYLMIERLGYLSHNDDEKNSSNFMNLITWFSSKNTQWVVELQKQLDIY